MGENRKKENLLQKIEETRDVWTSMADEIFDHPEAGFQETMASGLLVNCLKDHGFQVETGIAGMDTAFRAEYVSGDGGPALGLLCEYDALEGIGHACGHHMQGPSCVAAAVALKECLKDLDYRLVVYGTPAEETVGGKILMKEKGYFKDIDVALMMHPSPTTTTDVKCMALATFEVDFHGRTAHAAMNPEKGRSGLDAIMLAAHGIECLREHVLEDTRMHYTILDVGGPSNVVQANTKMEICMRSYHTAYVEHVAKRVRKIIEGAALMTETEFEIHEQPFFQAKIPVLSLNEVLMENARALECPTIRPPREKTGSTDFGNVMYDIPGSCIRMAFVPEGTSAHSEEYLKAGKSEEAHEATILAAKVLAGTCYDLIMEPELLKKVIQEFQEKKAALGSFK